METESFGQIYFPEEIDPLFLETKQERQNADKSKTNIFDSRIKNKALLKKRIGIIGAGVAGLSIALALQRCGFENVKVFERDETFGSRPQGYSLTLQQSMAFLNELGVGEEIYKSKLRQESRVIYDWQGNIIQQEKDNARNRWSIPIPRQRLRELMLKRIKPNTVLWNCSIVGLCEKPDKTIQVVLQDNSSENLHALIVCDGGWSKTRQYLVENGFLRDRKENHYTGVMMINGIAGNSFDLEFFYNKEIQIFDGQTRVFIKPFDTQRSMWQLTYPEQRSLFFSGANTSERLSQAKEKALHLIKDWKSPAVQLVEKTNIETMRAGHLFDRTPDTNLDHTVDNMTLAGDVAHFMTPFIGQGANNALWDAKDLAEALSSSISFKQAFRKYERKMLNRARYFVYRSRELTYGHL